MWRCVADSKWIVLYCSLATLFIWSWAYIPAFSEYASEHLGQVGAHQVAAVVQPCVTLRAVGV
jgi:hypothetical protein